MFHMKSIVFIVIISVYSAQSIANTLITIASGEKIGSDHPIAGLICRMLNKNTISHAISCSALATKGNQANIDALIKGEAQFAIVPANIQYNIFHDQKNIAKNKAYNEIRSVFSLYKLHLTFLVKKNSRIKGIESFKGKTINLGEKGSSEEEIINKILAIQGWDHRHFKRVFAFSLTEQINALCMDTLDIMVFASFHPNQLLNAINEKCEIRLLEINQPLRQKLIDESLFYFDAMIAKTRYSMLEKDIATIAVNATVVTTTQTPKDVVYNFTKSFFQQIDKIRAFHPSLAQLNSKEMNKKGLSAPLHSGAEAYFLEMN